MLQEVLHRWRVEIRNGMTGPSLLYSIDRMEHYVVVTSVESKEANSEDV